MRPMGSPIKRAKEITDYAPIREAADDAYAERIRRRR